MSAIDWARLEKTFFSEKQRHAGFPHLCVDMLSFFPVALRELCYVTPDCATGRECRYVRYTTLGWPRPTLLIMTVIPAPKDALCIPLLVIVPGRPVFIR